MVNLINGVCYVNTYAYSGDFAVGYMTVYDDSRIKFGTLDPIAQTVDEEFIQDVRDDSSHFYQFQPSDNGWLLGKGSYGYQAYNIQTGKMVNITAWHEISNHGDDGSGFCYWWENSITGYPEEFEKDGLIRNNI